MDSVEIKARELMQRANGSPIILLGHPIGFRQTSDMSPLVKSKCSRCDDTIQSSMVKEKIKELTKDSECPAAVICTLCMTEVVLKYKDQIDFRPFNSR